MDKGVILSHRTCVAVYTGRVFGFTQDSQTLRALMRLLRRPFGPPRNDDVLRPKTVLLHSLNDDGLRPKTVLLHSLSAMPRFAASLITRI